jgi:ATP synthase protein I
MAGDAHDGDRREEMAETVGRQAERKQRARREGRRGLWFGYGMFGLIGWAVAVPTLAGIAGGMWLDVHWPARFSWTLALLFGGVALGCLNALRWIHYEQPGGDDERDPP